MIKVIEKDEKTVQLDLSGDITADDYKGITPQIEDIFARHGRQKFLFNFDGVKKFSLGAMFQDVKFDLAHFKYIGTTAVVSTKAFAETVTKMVNATYPVKVEHFEDLGSARQWLNAQNP